MRGSCRLPSVGALLALLLYASVTTDAALQPDRQPTEGALAGQLLVAAPELADPNFQETVVYLVQHDRSGAMGLVINRVLGAGPLDRMLEGLGLAPKTKSKIELRVYYGGPVEPSRAFVLHSPDYHASDTLAVSDIAALSSRPASSRTWPPGAGRSAACSRSATPAGRRASWKSELAAGAWLVIEPDATLLFDQDTATKWQRAFDRRGIEL